MSAQMLHVEILASPPLNDRTTNAALVEKYGDVGYEGQSNALSHPDRMAVVATLFGLSPPGVADCRVLELGCSAGANLLPMAAGLPESRFVGCDLSPRAIAAARQAAAEADLGNVRFVEGDLAALPESLGEFDYIIAHGVYSWVPLEVRDAMFALAARRLSSNGVMFVSYNIYPGCHVRQAVWEALRLHVQHVDGARAKLDRARSLAAALAEAGPTQNKTDALLREEFKRVAQVSDSSLFHDDLAEPNDPVYFHEFVEHAKRHGLAFLAEAQPGMTLAGLAPRVQSLFAGLDRLEREQYLDFAYLRRFRQSLLCRSESATRFDLAPERLSSMRVAAAAPLLRAAAAGKPLVDAARPGAPTGAEADILRALFEWLVAIAPQLVAVPEIKSRLAWDDSGGASRPLESIIADAWMNGLLLLQLHPHATASLAEQKPAVSAFCRWQAAHGVRVTNLRHETMQLRDETALRLLTLLDGNRTRSEIAAAMGEAMPASDAFAREQRVDDYLRQFGKYALLLR
jgi:SAM-dependent methyltransferase